MVVAARCLRRTGLAERAPHVLSGLLERNARARLATIAGRKAHGHLANGVNGFQIQLLVMVVTPLAVAMYLDSTHSHG